MPYQIPRATLEKLNAPLTEGTRHANILAISYTLVGDGWPDQEIFNLLRGHFPPEKTDRELWDAIKGAHARAPAPLQRRSMYPASTFTPPAKPENVTPQQALANAHQFLRGFETDEASIFERSPFVVPEHEQGARCIMEQLYAADEFLNVICNYTVPEGKPNKANPYGPGKTLSAAEWIGYFDAQGVPASKAGAWIRPNPVTRTGSGKDGAISDTDVTSFRFLLVESDCLPLEVQLSMLAKLRLPVATLIRSGGASYHAWIRLNASSKEEFAAQAERIISTLSRFGIDRANKNPSRMARLPGVTRIIGAQNGGQQSLIYLNPNPIAAAIFP